MSARQEHSLWFDPGLETLAWSLYHDREQAYHRRARQCCDMLNNAIDATRPAVAARCVRMAERYAELAVYRIE